MEFDGFGWIGGCGDLKLTYSRIVNKQSFGNNF